MEVRTRTGSVALHHFWCLVTPLLKLSKNGKKKARCPSSPFLVFSDTVFECAQKTRKEARCPSSSFLKFNDTAKKSRKKAGMSLFFIFEVWCHRQKNMQKHGQMGFFHWREPNPDAQPLRKLLCGRARSPVSLYSAAGML